jgi:hypothetical protein
MRASSASDITQVQIKDVSIDLSRNPMPSAIQPVGANTHASKQAKQSE